jgi:23S rRNA (cytosine1962-C5)-methyltransferase
LRDALRAARLAQGSLVFLREHDGGALRHIHHIVLRRALGNEPMAFEPLVVPFRDARVLRHGGGLLVVDKPSGIPVHGGEESLGADLVTRLSEWLRARGGDGYLGVHQRLDLGTSGVMAFTTERERNAGVARAIEEHRFERRYVAAVTLRSSELSRRLERGPVALEHRLFTERGATSVVKQGGVEARATVALVERAGERALVELRPDTGKTHQLRVQLAHEGAPVGGDAAYGGDPAPRLLLHALELTLDGERFAAVQPAGFSTWVLGEAPRLGSDEELTARLADAAVLRAPLARSCDVYRLANDLGDELPGLTLDRYGDFAVLAVTAPEAERRARFIAEFLVASGARGVYLTVRERGPTNERTGTERHAPLAGDAAPERLVVDEHGMRFVVELGRGVQTGLFVDQRDNRRRVRELAGGARVLNLFSYTSSFGVAAALGGAAKVVNVDVSRRALDISRENFRENGVDPAAHGFEHEDALAWLARAEKRGERFELVVLDPPSFARKAGGAAFSVSEHYGLAAERSLRVLSPGGRLLAVTNHRKTSLGTLRRTLREAATRARVSIAKLKDLAPGLDCPDGPEGPVPSKSVLVTLERR